MSPEGPKHEDLVPDGNEVRSAGDIELPARKQNRLLQPRENNFSSNCADCGERRWSIARGEDLTLDGRRPAKSINGDATLETDVAEACLIAR